MVLFSLTSLCGLCMSDNLVYVLLVKHNVSVFVFLGYVVFTITISMGQEQFYFPVVLINDCKLVCVLYPPPTLTIQLCGIVIQDTLLCSYLNWQAPCWCVHRNTICLHTSTCM